MHPPMVIDAARIHHVRRLLSRRAGTKKAVPFGSACRASGVSHRAVEPGQLAVRHGRRTGSFSDAGALLGAPLRPLAGAVVVDAPAAADLAVLDVVHLPD